MNTTIKFNGTDRQNKWANSILLAAKLTETQVDNLLRYAGPTMSEKCIMDVTIIIEHRGNLAAYSDSLGKFYKLSKKEKHAVAMEAVGIVEKMAKSN